MDVNEELWLADTNVLLRQLETVAEKYKIVLCSITRRELDKHKTYGDEGLKYQARQANRYIFEHLDKFVQDNGEYDAESILGKDYGNEWNDNRIVACAVAKNYGIITNDLNMYITAKAFGVNVVCLNENIQDDTNYTGIMKVYVTTDSKEEELFAQVYQDPSINSFGLLTNQYIIFYDKEVVLERDVFGNPTKYKVLDKFRFDGHKIVKLKLPHKKVVTARNEEQECAIDMLFNKDIPIKFLIGTSGSGKSLLATKIGINGVVDTGDYAKMILTRNPVGSGEDIGFLPGDFDEKVDRYFSHFIPFFKRGELEMKMMEQAGQLEKHITYFMKGDTYDDAYMIYDEAEDSTQKIIKLVGTRIGQGGATIFCGDFAQAEDKYIRGNGLIHTINQLKGNPLVAVVALSEDERSEASKLFASL